ncbi:D-serine ammonia-lyase [Corynebacterium flavescens]|uniref:D-serine ammonia-lyase n=1 Tax=Corynebacterium flavescens TaxID=28028 RepID=UPI002649D0C7|nr:D-serine ammonia-lyase [Corynebacterium flavescens]MDN6474852.1 D-serine ammonia-lyase [Corynebacterium flavescens]MDN6530975.1 D-serine ammonia-lyase [Corynebacterium flavescens]MDN6822988.1 D-serine ammonia-lyase [Corynebacterium flavescens]
MSEHLTHLRHATPTSWLPKPLPLSAMRLDPALITDAQARLQRFAPWLARHFPDTDAGIIESPLQRAANVQEFLDVRFGHSLEGQLWLKRDDSLAVSGSIKARGGIHEVLMAAERLADSLAPDLPNSPAEQDAERFADLLDSAEFQLAAARRPIVVGSTGNLGLSIGTVGPALGFPTQVHVSVDAKAWKKELLRAKGAQVIEHSGLFSEAIAQARTAAKEIPGAYFVDDEYSFGLLAGYAVAALRLEKQLHESGVEVSHENPLHVYLPCGVGGGPGGVTFGLKHVFGDNVHCHFVEPTTSPCMFLGVLSGKGHAVSCQDYGLSGHTLADGLAVQRPSQLIVDYVAPHVSGFHTVEDTVMLAGVDWLHAREEVDVEVSATAGLSIPWREDLIGAQGTHLVWLTGGSLVPAHEREELLRQAQRF